MKLCLQVKIYKFNCVSFEKLWAVMQLRFQLLIESVYCFNFLGSGFDSSIQYHHGKVENQRCIKMLIRKHMHSQNNDNKERLFQIR